MGIPSFPFFGGFLNRLEQTYISFEEEVLLETPKTHLGENGLPVPGDEIKGIRALKQPEGKSEVKGH